MTIRLRGKELFILQSACAVSQLLLLLYNTIVKHLISAVSKFGCLISDIWETLVVQ